MNNESKSLPNKETSKGLNSQVKAFIVSLAIILILWIVSFILAKTLPAGEYIRDSEGKIIEFKWISKDLPFYKFILSPFLLFTSDGGSTVALILAFLLLVGGIMTVLNNTKVLSYALDRIVNKFGNKRYLLLFIIIFFFMFLGSFVGSFEEIVPFVPLLVVLVTKLGFDKYTGIGISLVAICSGFSCGVLNSFTVGIAQKLAGITPLFSGAWLRIVCFVIVYIALCIFIYFKAKKNAVENYNVKDLKISEKNEQLDKASLAFFISLLVGMLLVIVATFIEAISSISLLFIALGFLVGGILAVVIAKIPYKKALKDFLNGLLMVIPCVVMILFASSIRYILVESSRMDSILYYLISATNNTPKFAIVLIIYAIVLLFNLFIPSGSAKAFLLIPLLIPIAVNLGISKQVVILAFIFGDGFSNMMYPTNPVLIISLNVGDTSYPKYLKWIYPYFIFIFIFTISVLLLATSISY